MWLRGWTDRQERREDIFLDKELRDFEVISLTTFVREYPDAADFWGDEKEEASAIR
jgi:hypothetical protein